MGFILLIEVIKRKQYYNCRSRILRGRVLDCPKKESALPVRLFVTFRQDLLEIYENGTDKTESNVVTGVRALFSLLKLILLRQNRGQ